MTHRAGAAGGAIRIVVNPKAAQLSSSALQAVLEHEMVHVATRSPDSPAPTWAEEGLAEWVSMQAHPGQRSEATDEVLARVRATVHPDPFPPDRRFQVGARNLQRPTRKPGSRAASLPTSIPKPSWAGSMPSWPVEAQWTRRASPPSSSARLP